MGMLMPPPLLGGAMSWDCQAEDRYRRKGEEGGNEGQGLSLDVEDWYAGGRMGDGKEERRAHHQKERRTAGARKEDAADTEPARRWKAEGARKRSRRRRCVDVDTGMNAARRRMKAFSQQGTEAATKRNAGTRAGQEGRQL